MTTTRQYVTHLYQTELTGRIIRDLSPEHALIEWAPGERCIEWKDELQPLTTANAGVAA